jgi:Uma2 family endonuclease
VLDTDCRREVGFDLRHGSAVPGSLPAGPPIGTMDAEVSQEEPSMANVSTPPIAIETIADLLERLGGISPARIRFRPPPGTATERDVITIQEREKRLCELVDGVLVEKVMGFYEGFLAATLIRLLGTFVDQRDLGVVVGPDGMMRLAPGLVRIPDVSYLAWDRFPGRKVTEEPLPDLVPDLAIEVLSKGNTKKEMDRKLREYFDVGVRLVWFVLPEKRPVRVYTTPDQFTQLGADQTLDGGAVLPGFALPLRDLFDWPRRPRGE